MRKLVKSSLLLAVSMIMCLQLAAFTASAESFPCVGIVVGDTRKCENWSRHQSMTLSLRYGTALHLTFPQEKATGLKSELETAIPLLS